MDSRTTNVPSLDGEELLLHLLQTFKGNFHDDLVSCAYSHRVSTSHCYTTGTGEFKATN